MLVLIVVVIYNKGICSSPVLVFSFLLVVLLHGLVLLVLGFLFPLRLLLLGADCLQISGNEQVNQLLLLPVGAQLAAELQDFSGEQPEDHGDGLGFSVAAGNDDVDEVKGSIGVAEGDGGDVDIGGLNDGLLVGLGVGDDEEPGFLELLGELVGQGTGDPPGGGTGGAAGVLAELVDGSLAVLLGADDDDLVEVGDGGNDSGSQFDLIEGLVDFEDVVADGVLLLDVLLHVVVDFGGTEVHLGGEEPEDIVLVSFHKNHRFIY